MYTKHYYYVVQSGDTLSGIAQEFYGNAGLYPVLARRNHIPNANLIFPGEVIWLS